eukprot:1397214-Amphidinium_carterae.2
MMARLSFSQFLTVALAWQMTSVFARGDPNRQAPSAVFEGLDDIDDWDHLSQRVALDQKNITYGDS